MARNKLTRGDKLTWVALTVVACMGTASGITTATSVVGNTTTPTKPAATETSPDTAQVTKVASAEKNSKTSPPGSIADGKSWLEACRQRHGYPQQAPNMSYADSLLRSTIDGRCSNENHVIQGRAMKERREAILASSGRERSAKDLSDLAEMTRMIAKAQQQVDKADADIAAIRRGHAPQGMTLPTGKQRAADAGPISLKELERQNKLFSGFESVYTPCMGRDHGVNAFTPQQYRERYVERRSSLSKEVFNKAKKAHTTCKAKALKAHPEAAALDLE